MHLKHAETETPSEEIEDMEMKQVENNTMAKIKTKQNNSNKNSVNGISSRMEETEKIIREF